MMASLDCGYDDQKACAVDTTVVSMSRKRKETTLADPSSTKTMSTPLVHTGMDRNKSMHDLLSTDSALDFLGQ